MQINYNYVFIKSYRNERVKITYSSEEIITDIDILEDIAITLAEKEFGGQSHGWEVFFDLDFYYLERIKL